MEPRYYDAAGRVNYEAIETYSGELRHQAIDAFWSALFAKLKPKTDSRTRRARRNREGRESNTPGMTVITRNTRNL